jgi:hypothetical protein
MVRTRTIQTARSTRNSVTAGFLVAAVSASGRPRGARPTVTTRETPTDRAVNDAVRTDGTTFAVGDGGLVCRRDEGTWETVRTDGPGGAGVDLHAVDVTEESERLWLAGSGGRIYTYDVAADRFEDRSPAGAHGIVERVAVVGTAGSETVYAAEAGGGVLVSFSSDPRAEWTDVTRGAVGTTYVGP